MTSEITIDERELEERFVRASGPGGQNVNKVATAVELRFDTKRSSALKPDVVRRLIRLAGRRTTDEGVIIIRAERFRTQERNRIDARSRLAELIKRALQRPKKRVATKPTAASKARRLERKTRRGEVKKLRSGRPASE